MRPSLPPRHTLEVRREALTRARNFFGIESDSQLARHMGIDVGQMSRVLLGKSEPGTRFIAELLSVLGVEFFSQIFAVVPVDEKKSNGERVA